MKTFPKPENLNGDELIAELAAVGILIKDIWDNSDGTISFETDDESEAGEIVAAHNGTTTPRERSITEKLESVGLSLEELREALAG